jgi:hypothetical protein
LESAGTSQVGIAVVDVLVIDVLVLVVVTIVVTIVVVVVVHWRESNIEVPALHSKLYTSECLGSHPELPIS